MAWDCTYPEAMTQLRECEAAGEWSLQLRQRAIFLQPGTPPEAREVAADISAAYAERREGDLARLAELEEMLSSHTCLNSALESYFTGSLLAEPCGRCPACRGEQVQLPDFPPGQPLPPDTELPEFDRPAQRRRFLAGIASPGLMARRLWSHPHYASAAHTLWEEL